MNGFDHLLERVVDEMEWPPAPRVSARVIARLHARRRRHRHIRLGLVVLAALLSTTGAVFAAVPPFRGAVVDLLGLEGLRVERLPSIPNTAKLAPGRQLAAADVEQLLGFELLIPTALGPPDALFHSTYTKSDEEMRQGRPGGEVHLVYRARRGQRSLRGNIGALVTLVRTDRDTHLISKLLGEAATVEQFQIDGHAALWVQGPHGFSFRVPPERRVVEQVRLATNVLIVQRGEIIVRIESRLARDEAIGVARSLEPARAR